MPLPGDLTTITVNFRYTSLGAPIAGSVTFEPSVTTLLDTIAPTFILGAVTGQLDDNGQGAVIVPCTDNAGLSPSGWVWKVTENLIGRPARASYYVSLPHTLGAAIDLEDLAPLDPPQTHSTFYGLLDGANTWLQLNNFANGLEVGGVLIVVPPGGTSRFLAADGTWQLPPSGAVVSVNSKTGAVVLNSGDVGAVPESLVTAKGDLLVASGNGTVARLAAGANGQLLRANSAAANGVDYVDPPTGGSTTIVRDAFITSGSITFNSDAAFTAYPAIGISIPASVGDKIAVTFSGMWAKVGGDFCDVGNTVGGSPVRMASSQTATSAIEGVPWLYPDTAFRTVGGVFSFTATSGDIDTDGSIHVALFHRGPAGGTWFANTNYATSIHAVNYGH